MISPEATQIYKNRLETILSMCSNGLNMDVHQLQNIKQSVLLILELLDKSKEEKEIENKVKRLEQRIVEHVKRQYN